MFTSSPRYLTLTQQVARDLEKEIRRGVLRESLPGERQLAEKMQVSRRTIRAATEILCEKKLVRSEHRMPTRILAAPPKLAGRSSERLVGLLLPKPLEQLKPFTATIDILRGTFHTNGIRMDTHFGHRYLTHTPDAALKRLITRFPSDGWILSSPNREGQAWFCSAGIATVVCGTVYDDIPLSSVDIDMFAVARHAANYLLRRGHRRLGLVIEAADWAGHRKTENGFLEAVHHSSHPATGSVFLHGGGAADLHRMIVRIMQGPTPPTALFIVNPYHYLAVSAILADRGLVVPRDISLMCRDYDACLDYLPVKPTCFANNAKIQAKEIFSSLLSTLRANPGSKAVKTVRVLPELIEGASVGAPPGGRRT